MIPQPSPASQVHPQTPQGIPGGFKGCPAHCSQAQPAKWSPFPADPFRPFPPIPLDPSHLLLLASLPGPHLLCSGPASSLGLNPLQQPAQAWGQGLGALQQGQEMVGASGPVASPDICACALGVTEVEGSSSTEAGDVSAL